MGDLIDLGELDTFQEDLSLSPLCSSPRSISPELSLTKALNQLTVKEDNTREVVTANMSTSKPPLASPLTTQRPPTPTIDDRVIQWAQRHRPRESIAFFNDLDKEPAVSLLDETWFMEQTNGVLDESIEKNNAKNPFENESDNEEDLVFFGTVSEKEQHVSQRLAPETVRRTNVTAPFQPISVKKFTIEDNEIESLTTNDKENVPVQELGKKEDLEPKKEVEKATSLSQLDSASSTATTKPTRLRLPTVRVKAFTDIVSPNSSNSKVQQNGTLSRIKSSPLTKRALLPFSLTPATQTPSPKVQCGPSGNRVPVLDQSNSMTQQGRINSRNSPNHYTSPRPSSTRRRSSILNDRSVHSPIQQAQSTQSLALKTLPSLKQSRNP